MVVGGGPTGVEIAGQIGELARDTLQRYFSNVDPGDVRILLVEMADRLLAAFPESLSAKASRSLSEARRDADGSTGRWSTSTPTACR